MPDTSTPIQEGSPPKRSRFLSFVLPALALAAVGGWFLTRNGNPSAEAGSVSSIQSTVHLETFVLNLADSDQRAYLRVGIDLGLGRELKRDEPVPVAQIRDTVLGVLAQAKAEELLSADGKTKLKEKLLRSLQERIPRLGIEEVYFTEFLIQR